jgi:RING-box protein 1
MSCTIKSVNLRGTWNLDTINDECPICRNSVLETCVECSAATSQTQCISIMGECSHIYHLHCIDKWTKTKNVCPLDNKKWEYKRPQKSIEQSKTCLNCLTPDLDVPIQENQINPDVPETIQNVPNPIINIINIPNNNYIINYINTSINTSTTDLSNNIVVGSSTISNNNNYTNDLSNNIFISNLYNNYINTSDLSNNQISNQQSIQQSDQEDDAQWADIDSDEDDEDYQDEDDDDDDEDDDYEDDDDEIWEDIDEEGSELDTNNNPTQ